MRSTTLLLGTAVFVAQATLDAAPRLIAEREGGMGLGSALIGAGIAGIAGLVVGALVGAVIVERGSTTLSALGGSVLAYTGIAALGLAPMGALLWLVMAFMALGAGLGALMTVSFADAAAAPMRSRAAAIGLLLGALLMARPAGASLLRADGFALEIGGLVVVLAALLATRLGIGMGSAVPADSARDRVSVGRSVAGALLLGSGAGLLLAGADPSGLSAILVGGLVGVTGMDTITLTRTVLLAAGLVLVAAGAAASRTTPRGPLVGRAALGVAVTTFGAAALVASIGAAARAAGGSGDIVGWAGLASLAGSVAGLVAWWWWAARWPGDPLPAALAGGALLAVAAAVTLASAVTGLPVPLSIVGAFFVGAGMLPVVASLRLMLAGVPAPAVARAAAAGVVAAGLGAPLGGLAGAAAGSWGSAPASAAIASATLLGAFAALGFILRSLARGERTEMAGVVG